MKKYISIIISLVFLFLAVRCYAGINRTGLVLEMDMDNHSVYTDGAIIYDSSGQNNHGTLGDGSTPSTYPTSATGVTGQSRAFNGMQYIDCGNDASE